MSNSLRPSMGFSRQENWSHFLLQGYLVPNSHRKLKIIHHNKDLKFQPLACSWGECNPCNKALWVFSLVSRALLSMQSFFFFFWLLNHVWLFVTPRTAAHQVPLSMGFPGKNTGVGCQGIFLVRNQTLVSCIGRWILYQLATGEVEHAILKTDNWK